MSCELFPKIPKYSGSRVEASPIFSNVLVSQIFCKFRCGLFTNILEVASKLRQFSWMSLSLKYFADNQQFQSLVEDQVTDFCTIKESAESPFFRSRGTAEDWKWINSSSKWRWRRLWGKPAGSERSPANTWGTPSTAAFPTKSPASSSRTASPRYAPSTKCRGRGGVKSISGSGSRQSSSPRPRSWLACRRPASSSVLGLRRHYL